MLTVASLRLNCPAKEIPEAMKPKTIAINQDSDVIEHKPEEKPAAQASEAA